MKRKTVHLGFAATALLLASVATLQWLELHKAVSIAQGLSQIPQELDATDKAAQVGQSSRYPEVLLARANALSAGGNVDAAESAFNELIRLHEFDSIGHAARFNLANVYLRQGMRSDAPVSRTRPMLELAKQRYRDLLRVKPTDWNARYNLERTLRLAPEKFGASSGNKVEPVKSVRVIVPGFRIRDLP